MRIPDGESYDAAQMAREADGRWLEDMQQARMLRMGAEVMDVLASALEAMPRRVTSDETLSLKMGQVMDALGKGNPAVMAEVAQEVRDEIFKSAESREGQAQAALDNAEFLYDRDLGYDAATGVFEG